MINKKIIANIIGFLLILTGIFMILGISFSLYYGDSDVDSLLISGGGIIILGSLLVYFTKDHKKEISKRDGYIIVSSGWVVISLAGAIPFVVDGAIPSYTDAFFETMSGFTTTGASILDDIESLPHGLLFWRSITQWMGGMGIIVLSLAILPILGIGGMQLFVAEVPGPTKDKIHPRIKETAKRLWGIYFLLTLVEAALLFVGGMTLFDSICHSFTTMATGGFSTKQASVGFYASPFIHYVIILFMFFAGMNFSLHYHLLHGRVSRVTKDEEFRTYWIFIIAIAILLAIALLVKGHGGPEKSFRDSLFQVVSIVTTTGYVTSDYETWGGFYQLFFFILLFAGGSAGSTGGGIKMVRHLLLVKNSVSELARLIHPRAIIPVRYNHASIASEVISNILAFFLFYIAIFIFGAVIMSIIGLDFLTAIGSVATSLGNVGPAIAGVGPSTTFSSIPDAGKWFLSFFMLLGRLELFTVLVILSPAFWRK